MIKKKILLQFLSFLQHHCRTAVLWWTNASFVQHVVAIYLYLTSTLRRSMRARFDFAPFAYPFILRGTQIHSQNWFFVHVEVSFWQHQKSSHGTNSSSVEMSYEWIAQSVIGTNTNLLPRWSAISITYCMLSIRLAHIWSTVSWISKGSYSVQFMLNWPQQKRWTEISVVRVSLLLGRNNPNVLYSITCKRSKHEQEQKHLPWIDCGAATWLSQFSIMQSTTE